MTSRSKDQDLVDELVAQMSIPDAPRAQTNGHVRPAKAQASSSGPSDEQVIEKCRAAENAAKFSALFDRGDVRTPITAETTRSQTWRSCASWRSTPRTKRSSSASSPRRRSVGGRSGAIATTTARGRSARPLLGSARPTTGAVGAAAR